MIASVSPRSREEGTLPSFLPPRDIGEPAMHRNAHPPKERPGRRNRWPYILLVTALALLGLVILESAARYLWHKKYTQMLEQQLHGMDHVDYERAVLVPDADTTITVQDYRAGLGGHGKPIGLAHLDRYIDEYGLTPGDVIVRINRQGFKGPDLETPRPEGTFRVLTVGDSCTWGPALDRYAYPRILEQEMNAWGQPGRTYEVVNAGVYGYNTESVLNRADDFLATDPDLILNYIGWNRTIARADSRKSNTLYRALALYRIYYHLIRNRAGTNLKQNFNQATYFDKNEEEILRLSTIDFQHDMKDLRTFVRRARQRNPDVRIALITLAGLFDDRVEPDAAALMSGYPIATTNNLYAWSLLTKGYNEALRGLAQAEGLDLIDFEEYVFQNIRPRSGFFSDSVHPTIDGYKSMALFLAAELKKRLAPEASSRSGPRQ